MTTSSAESPPSDGVLIEARRGWVPIDLPEIWRDREPIAFLAMRDVKVRHKRSLLGAAWAVLASSVIVVTPLLVGSLYSFRRMERTFADPV